MPLVTICTIYVCVPFAPILLLPTILLGTTLNILGTSSRSGAPFPTSYCTPRTTMKPANQENKKTRVTAVVRIGSRSSFIPAAWCSAVRQTLRVSSHYYTTTTPSEHSQKKEEDAANIFASLLRTPLPASTQRKRRTVLEADRVAPEATRKSDCSPSRRRLLHRIDRYILHNLSRSFDPRGSSAETAPPHLLLTASVWPQKKRTPLSKGHTHPTRLPRHGRNERREEAHRPTVNGLPAAPTNNLT